MTIEEEDDPVKVIGQKILGAFIREGLVRLRGAIDAHLDGLVDEIDGEQGEDQAPRPRRARRTKRAAPRKVPVEVIDAEWEVVE